MKKILGVLLLSSGLGLIYLGFNEAKKMGLERKQAVSIVAIGGFAGVAFLSGISFLDTDDTIASNESSK